MIASETLSTGEAAQLAGVHRSTLKRWCDEGTLSCSVTDGGHRRIALSALLSAAERGALNCSLLDFNEPAERVWDAVQRAERQDDYDEVIRLTYEWLTRRDTEDVHSLLTFLREREWALSVLFDRLLCSVMYRIGDEWIAGEIDVGDEHRMSHEIFRGLYDLEPSGRAPPPDTSSTPVAVVGAGPGNRHEMGALMTRLTLEARNWQTIYLGPDVPIRNFALQQDRYGADLICISLAPPSHTPSDIARILEPLARLPDATCDHRVAFGGLPVQDEEVPDETPFLDARGFSQLTDFVDWVQSFRSSIASAP